MPENVNREETFAYTDTASTSFGKVISEESVKHVGKSGFHLLANGLDAFVARVVLAHHAERSLDVQYYLYHDDLVGKLFTDQLLKAADRGVRVRLLLDDMDLAGRDKEVSALDSHPNMEVRIFNPFSRKTGRTSQFVTRMGSVTRRMHNKSYIVDNQVAILGGRNIGDEYFDAHPDLAFSDLDVMIIGPAAKEASTAFDKYWNNELAYPTTPLMGEPPTAEEVARIRGQLDEFVVQQAESEYLQALHNSDLAEKIRAKQVFIGSLNLDPRAVKHNTEIGLVLTSSEIANMMGDGFDQNIEQKMFRLELVKNENGTESILWHGQVDGKEIVFDVDPYTGFWRRFGIGFMSLMPIESQL